MRTPLGYRPLTPEIKARRLAAGLSQTDASRLVHSALRSWQQWEAPEGSKYHRRMSAAVWELFVLKTEAVVEMAATA